MKGFRAINLFGVVFARKELNVLEKRVLNHESIHTRQMLELLFVGFYLWYIVEWLIKCIIYKNTLEAYKNISFEREAFLHDDNLAYLSERRFWSFTKYIKKKTAISEQ